MTSDFQVNKTGLVAVFVSDLHSSCEEQLELLKENVREIIDYDKTFNNAEICHEFIRSVRYERIFLIVTPKLVEDIFEQNIPEIRHVQAIFIFDPLGTIGCTDDLKNSSYKVQDVFKSSSNLVHCLWQFVKECANGLDIFLSSLASCSTDATTNVINNFADFSEFWYPLYIDFLLSDSAMSDEKTRFVKQCRLHFGRNPSALKLIDDFENNYDSTPALSYYSRDGFVYRIINRALRRQILESVLDLRFFLRKVRAELQAAYGLFELKYDVGDWMTLFRGQRMSKDELEKLKKKYRDGTLITTNSYLSTSMSRETALFFAGRPAADITPILFEISAQFKDPKIQQSKPFAYIGQFSKYGFDELEVLFSVGSFFKIYKIDYDESTSICTVKMTFIDDAEEKFVVVEDFRALRACSPEVKLFKIGNLISYYPSKGLSQAAIFYEIIQNRNFSPMFTAVCYAGLGWLALKEKNEDLAIERQNMALTFYEKLNDKSDNLTFLYMTSFNCIGAALRMKKKYNEALAYYLKADELLVLRTPIDKYAMYDSYRNVPSVNIASIYKMTNCINRAWEKYKNILACEMNSSNRFHGHTFLTIAQAGLHETSMTHDKKEYQQCSQSWKAFLDLSLTDMSSNYRRSIVSGVLLIGFEFETNEQTRSMAIDYFNKVINISRKYVNVSRDDYYIVLKCYFELAHLYQKNKPNYMNSIAQSTNALKVCRSDDLESIAECYKRMAETYEQQFSEQIADLTPDDICAKLCDPFFKPLETDDINHELPQTPGLVFKQNEFAFGQYKIALNPNLASEHDHKRQFAYCYLKMAALAQHQGDLEATQAKIKEEENEVDEANQHKKKSQAQLQTARQLLIKVGSLLQDPSVQIICANNLAYLDGNFDSIIAVYQAKLNSLQLPCVGEDVFCYIGHLFGRKSNLDEEKRWCELAVEHFKQHIHICKHTVPCFVKLAKFYEKTQNFLATIDVYDSLVQYLMKYRPPSFLHESIVPIVMPLIQHFIDKSQWELTIAIFEHLIRLILKECGDDLGIDKEFQNILESCKNIGDSVMIETYSCYLESMLRYRALSYHTHLRAIEPAFRRAILIYKTRNDTRRLISVYQKFLELIISSTSDFNTLLAAFQRLALDLETIHLVDAALDMYVRLAQFIVTYGMKEGKLKAGFTIGRYRLLAKNGAALNIGYEQTIVQLMVYYRNVVEPQFVIDDYLKTMKANLKRDGSATSIYMDMLEFYMKYRPEHYEQHFKTTINALRERPAEIIAFVNTTRANYVPLIETLFQHLIQLSPTNQAPYSSAELSSRINFEAEAKLWLERKDQVDDALCYGKCLQCILELHSIDDEYLASSYVKMGDKTHAATVFNKFIYGDPALKYNANACRRYLRYVYNEILTIQECNDIEHRYAKHFVLEGNVASDNYSFEILPLEDFDIN